MTLSPFQTCSVPLQKWEPHFLPAHFYTKPRQSLRCSPWHHLEGMPHLEVQGRSSDGGGWSPQGVCGLWRQDLWEVSKVGAPPVGCSTLSIRHMGCSAGTPWGREPSVCPKISEAPVYPVSEARPRSRLLQCGLAFSKCKQEAKLAPEPQTPCMDTWLPASPILCPAFLCGAIDGPATALSPEKPQLGAFEVEDIWQHFCGSHRGWAGEGQAIQARCPQPPIS